MMNMETASICVNPATGPDVSCATGSNVPGKDKPIPFDNNSPTVSKVENMI